MFSYHSIGQNIFLNSEPKLDFCEFSILRHFLCLFIVTFTEKIYIKTVDLQDGYEFIRDGYYHIFDGYYVNAKKDNENYVDESFGKNPFDRINRYIEKFNFTKK